MIKATDPAHMHSGELATVTLRDGVKGCLKLGNGYIGLGKAVGQLISYDTAKFILKEWQTCQLKAYS